MSFTERLLAMVSTDMKRRGRSARAMAELLGVNHSTLSCWLQGIRVPDGTSVDGIVRYFGTRRVIESLRRADLDRGRPESGARRVA